MIKKSLFILPSGYCTLNDKSNDKNIPQPMSELLPRKVSDAQVLFEKRLNVVTSLNNCLTQIFSKNLFFYKQNIQYTIGLCHCYNPYRFISFSVLKPNKLLSSWQKVEHVRYIHTCTQIYIQYAHVALLKYGLFHLVLIF